MSVKSKMTIYSHEIHVFILIHAFCRQVFVSWKNKQTNQKILWCFENVIKPYGIWCAAGHSPQYTVKILRHFSKCTIAFVFSRKLFIYLYVLLYVLFIYFFELCWLLYQPQKKLNYKSAIPIQKAGVQQLHDDEKLNQPAWKVLVLEVICSQ